jgi:hypothetical protein
MFPREMPLCAVYGQTGLSIVIEFPIRMDVKTQSDGGSAGCALRRTAGRICVIRPGDDTHRGMSLRVKPDRNAQGQ